MKISASIVITDSGKMTMCDIRPKFSGACVVEFEHAPSVGVRVLEVFFEVKDGEFLAIGGGGCTIKVVGYTSCVSIPN